MIIDPRPSFQTVWLNQKCWYLKNVQKDVECRQGCQRMAKRISLGYSWPSVSTWGSRMVAFKLQKHFDTHWPGEDDYRPASFFPNGLVEPKVLVPKECAEGCRMQKGWSKGWLSGSVWVTAGHQSARGVLEWLPSSSKSTLTRIDLGKMIIDPPPSFQTVWLNQKCLYLKNIQKDVECRRGVKGWLSGSVWVTAGHQSAPRVLEWLPSSSKSTWHALTWGRWQ